MTEKETAKPAQVLAGIGDSPRQKARRTALRQYRGQVERALAFRREEALRLAESETALAQQGFEVSDFIGEAHTMILEALLTGPAEDLPGRILLGFQVGDSLIEVPEYLNPGDTRDDDVLAVVSVDALSEADPLGAEERGRDSGGI